MNTLKIKWNNPVGRFISGNRPLFSTFINTLMKNLFISFLLFCFPFLLSSQAQGVLFNTSNIPVKVNILPTQIPHRDITINKGMTEIYFTIQGHSRSFSAIAVIKKNGNKWSSPEITSFSGEYNDLEPSLSPDGKRLYFASNRPTVDNPSKKDMDIWYVERTVNGWSKPINLGDPINTPGNEFYPCIINNGSVYFTAQYDRSKGADIYCAKLINGKYDKPEPLGQAINENSFEINPFVAPDETFIIFSVLNRKENIGRSDLYISVKDSAGNWKKSIILSEPINSVFSDYCPFVTADKKYLFFTSDRATIVNGKKYSYDELIKIVEGHSNGLEAVYCMSFEALFEKANRQK